MLACRRSTHLDETGRHVGSQRLIQERGLQHPRQHLCVPTQIRWQLRDPKHESKGAIARTQTAADLEHGGAISADDVLQDMSMSPMHGDGFEQVLSDDDGLACVPRQKAVRELEFLDVNSPAVMYLSQRLWKLLSATLPCMRHFLPRLSTMLQHRIWHTGYMQHLLPWLSTMLH